MYTALWNTNVRFTLCKNNAILDRKHKYSIESNADKRRIALERYQQILEHALYREALQKINIYEKDRKFCCHTLEHFCDVARIMYILALEEQSDLEQDVIYATALLHDIGRVIEYKDGTPHDKASQDMAKIILTDIGYKADEIQLIIDAIGSHRKKEEPEHTLASYLYRADDLSRNCFACAMTKECYWDETRKNHTLTL